MSMSPTGIYRVALCRTSFGYPPPTSFGKMSFPQKSSIVAVLFAFVVLVCSATLTAQQKEREEGEIPFLYPDPRTVGLHPYQMQGKQPGPVTSNRYAGVSEQERFMRELQDYCAECEGLSPSKYEQHDQPPCPLCEEDYKTPCGKCKMCVAGFPCELTLCRHCLQPRSKFMGNACDLTAGDEPCGTCDACREHRSDPCEHADDGWDRRGQFNPYHERRLFSVIPKPILDTYNNGARKFPVYYNSAPYYRPTWNPSLYAGYARPFTFRWSCGLCFRNPCECDQPGLAGQISYAYACKFCNRNPCACAQDICDVNKPMDPKGIAQALAAVRGEAEGAQPVAIQETQPTGTTRTGTAPGTVTPGGGTISTEGGLFDDSPTPDQNTPIRQRPSLDAPTPQPSPSVGSSSVS